MSSEERHRKMQAVLSALHEIINEGEGRRLDVILMVSARGSESLNADYASTIGDRRRALAVLREQVRHFEEQLGAKEDVA